MKKLFTLLAFAITLIATAQAPQGFNYQATVRNSSGALLLNQIVLVKFNVFQNSATGTLVYSENQTANTDDLGHIALVVGQGTATTGTFSNINWASGTFYLGIELNTGSGGYVAMGTTQLLSVPYALYANSSGNSQSVIPNLSSVLAVNNGANNLQIKNLADPTDNQDAVTKSYLQSQINILQQQINNNLISQYPAGSLFCSSGPTQIVPVLSPTTGKIWMDRNLGASQVATSSTDALAYGDLYQWGRRADGHQCRNSNTTSTLSSSDQPSSSNFILNGSSLFDWRSPQNTNLWQGINGVNNPCPNGYRIATNNEFNAEKVGFTSQNAAGAYSSIFKFTVGGNRVGGGGQIIGNDGYGSYWTSSISSTLSNNFFFDANLCTMYNDYRANGLAVRCIKN